MSRAEHRNEKYKEMVRRLKANNQAFRWTQRAIQVLTKQSGFECMQLYRRNQLWRITDDQLQVVQGYVRTAYAAMEADDEQSGESTPEETENL